MLRTARERLGPFALALLLAGPLLLLGQRVVVGMGVDRPYDVLHVPESSALRLLSPGLRLTIANLYWLSTVQYVGDRRAQERGWAKLHALGDLVTDLDPRHGYAYQSVGLVLSAAGRLDESDRILEKGQRHAPRWTFPFYLAFNHFFYRGDYEAAARWAEVAAKMPGASTRISHLALSLKVKSGSPDDAVRFLEEMRGTASDDRTADAIDEQLRIALLQRNFAVLDEAVTRFRELRGRPPQPLEEIVWSGLLAVIPEDPYGGRYYADGDGHVHSTAKDFRMKPAENLGRFFLPKEIR